MDAKDLPGGRAPMMMMMNMFNKSVIVTVLSVMFIVKLVC